MICPFLPFIGLIICFISPSTGVLITLFSILLNIVLSGTLNVLYDQDLKSLFYTAKVLKEGYHLDQIKGTPEVNTNFSHFKGARLFSGLLGKVGRSRYWWRIYYATQDGVHGRLFSLPYHPAYVLSISRRGDGLL